MSQTCERNVNHLSQIVSVKDVFDDIKRFFQDRFKQAFATFFRLLRFSFLFGFPMGCRATFNQLTVPRAIDWQALQLMQGRTTGTAGEFMGGFPA